MLIDTITNPSELEKIAPAWYDLWHRDPSATPFQSPGWLLPWWQHFGSDGLSCFALRNGETLQALLPLYILRDEESDESLGMLLGTGISDYLDALAAPSVSIAPLLEAAAGADCQMWDLQQLRPSSPLLTTPLPDGASDNVEDQQPCPVMSLENAGEELSNLISPHFRKKLRYYRRALERLGSVSVESPSSASDLDPLLEALYELHAARWRRRGLPGVLADDTTREFHRQVARAMLADNSLRLYATRLGDRIVAVFYGFAHHGTVYYYLSGYDPELEKLSIGTLIIAHAIEDAVRKGDTSFDFLRGAEEYKYVWGAKDRLNRRRQIFRA